NQSRCMAPGIPAPGEDMKIKNNVYRVHFEEIPTSCVFQYCNEYFMRIPEVVILLRSQGDEDKSVMRNAISIVSGRFEHFASRCLVEPDDGAYHPKRKTGEEE